MTPKMRMAIPIALVMSSHACSKSQPNRGGPATSKSAEVAEKPVASGAGASGAGWTPNKVCALLDRADVVARLGEADLRMRKEPPDGTLVYAWSIECIFERTKPGYVKIHVDVPSRKDEFGKNYPRAIDNMVSIPGIGDAAYQGKLDSILYVKKGDTTFWVQGASGHDEKTFLQNVARKAASRI